ncbi:MAG: divalent metal cation transporter [Bacteroidetes bacterium]|jgi:Mn2+/Fe2+ NRAMP family transporter|nr:divalent metal cation transporter [Bacteroidota bacterium]
MKFLREIGPASLIAAAFIGPGTVSVCALAGIQNGYALIWVMLVSMFLTVFLQELSARMAIVFQKDLIELIKLHFGNKILLKYLVYALIFMAIIFGNAAYEAGNLSGVNIGLQIMDYNSFHFKIFGIQLNYAILLISFLAFIILHLKSYHYIEKTLMILVGLLSLSFIFSAVITTHHLKDLFNGIFTPAISQKDILLVSALIGTTVVPYNLFLHASLAKQKWKNDKGIYSMRVDTFIAVALGILVSICIIITSANVSNKIDEVSQLGIALEPLYGSFSVYLLGGGYIAAGLTSAVTAPLAAAFVLNTLFDFNYRIESIQFKRLSYAILLIGCIIATLDFNPINVITAAQIANAIALPVMVIILIWLSKKAFSANDNFIPRDLINIIVILICLALSLASLYKIILQ